MLRPTGLQAFCVASLLFSALQSGASLAAAEIRDDANLFTPAVRAAAEARLSQLEKQHRHGIVIETYATVPNGQVDSVKAMSPAAKEKFYGDWLKRRAGERKAEGLFILVTKEPGHVQPGVSRSLSQAGFDAAAKQAVMQSLLGGFRAKQFDAGLEQAVTTIEERFAKLQAAPLAKAPQLATQPAQTPAPAVAPAVSNFGGLTSILFLVAIVIGGVMLVSMLMRALSGGMGGGYGGGGGGFGTGLLGGLFGAMAGHWIYDSFFNSNSAHAGESSLFGHDTSSTAGNDSWDTSGGADFGGGGGDFGGGDFGGGGDF